MLGRAGLAFVVFDISYIQHKIITVGAFYTLIRTAFWLNAAVPVTIVWWNTYYRGQKLETKHGNAIKALYNGALNPILLLQFLWFFFIIPWHQFKTGLGPNLFSP